MRQSENFGPSFCLDSVFDAAPISNMFLSFELSTKAAFAKAAFDTLQEIVVFHYRRSVLLFKKQHLQTLRCRESLAGVRFIIAQVIYNR